MNPKPRTSKHENRPYAVALSALTAPGQALPKRKGLISILAGKRKISATLAGKLGKFFGVSPALFIPI